MFHAKGHGLNLVDWTHAVPHGAPLAEVPDHFQHWYPREFASGSAATSATDIYMAAKCMVYLAGGDPKTNHMPPNVPQSLQRFFLGCLFDSPAMRPQDAWDLHEEFSHLLEDVYGEPRYHHLDMS